MKRLSTVFLALALAGCAAAPDPLSTAASETHARFLQDVDALLGRATALDSAAEALAAGAPSDVVRAFENARDAWKRVEFLVEHYAPSTAEQLNGPAIDEVEPFDANRMVLRAEGFQVIEELLYPTVDTASAAELAVETGRLVSIVRRVEQYGAAMTFSPENVWEAARLEMVRIAALGITGFDSPIARRSIPEAALAVAGVRAGLAPWLPVLDGRAPDAGATLRARLDAMEAVLHADSGFDGFDRLAFLRDHVQPTVAAIADARDALRIPPPRGGSALRPEARTLFTADAFDPSFFAAPGASTTPALVALGEQLFFDRRLSADHTRSCGSCHQPAHAFSDGLARSVPLDAAPHAVLRNAPTLLNAGLQAGSFYDLRTEFLEDQVRDVVSNPAEMHGSLDQVLADIRATPAYARLLTDAFGDAEADALGLRRALAAYMRTLTSMDSPVDRYLRGEDVTLSAEQRAGFNLFMGRAGCGTCHFAPLFNGTVPPTYQRTEIEVLGVPETPAATRIDPDSGAFRVLGNPLHVHGFKTTTVRNVALTSPYMHNGVYRTLDEVIDFYDAGGGAGLGIAVDHQTLPPDSLHLTTYEKHALVRFLEALTDTSAVHR